MALLHLDRAHLEVKTEGETLALYESGQRRGTVPIALIDRCIIHGSHTLLDTGVLQKLAEAGVTTVLMSPRNQRRFAIVLGPQHNDAAVRLAQAARVLDDTWCRTWALATVTAKLARQCRTLRTLMAQRPDARKPLFDALTLLSPQLAELRANLGSSAYSHTDLPPPNTPNTPNTSPTVPSLDSLRGREGAAARAYFSGLMGVFAPALTFTGRNRRPPRDPVNAVLSLGYTLLHAQAVQACVAAGLDPLLGFYHRPSFGRESLASDLIEPLRPAVDLWVWECFKDQTLRADHFNHDKGACLMGKAGRQSFYAAWEERQAPWQRWLRRQARQLAAQMRAQGQVWVANPADEEEPC